MPVPDPSNRAAALVLLACLFAAGLVGCDQPANEPSASEKSAATDRKASIKAELDLMTDPVRSIGEIERRLAERIRKDGDLVVVRDQISQARTTVHVLPRNAPWTISCSRGGLTVSFGSIDEDAIGLRLSRARLSEQECTAAALIAARKMKQLLSD